MKFAFSTVACPDWDFDTLAARAREYGYDGVEIRGFLDEPLIASSNIFLTDPAKVRAAFADQGIAIACLASSIAFSGKRKADHKSGRELMRFIDTARDVGCPMVKIADAAVRPGQSRTDLVSQIAHWLAPLADFAAERNVTLVIENLLSFRNAKEMWQILELINHPSVAVCWDVANAALNGETPAVSVPVLNNRIQHVHVKDAQLGALGALYVKLGEGNVAVKDFIRRLMGIGYEGYVCFEWEKAWLANLAPPEEALPAAITTLKAWTRELSGIEEEDGDAAPAGGEGDGAVGATAAANGQPAAAH